MHRALEVKAQPFLNPSHSATLRQIQKQNEIQNNRGGQNTVAAQEINLDLHGITEPSVDVDVVPTFLIIPARRIVMDPHFMREILIKVWIELRLEDLIQNRKFALFLCFEGIRVIEDFAVAVAQNV